jgi:SulP family sulfate permease
MLPWNAPGTDGVPVPFSFHLLRDLLPGALAVAMLGAIESLLSAVVADGMARTRHDPDAELLAQGFGNLLCPFFGGIPATGAIARTATNIRSGGRSPVAAMTHALTVLLAVLALAPLIGTLPMCSLAALLLLVAWNMSEARHFIRMLRSAPKSDVAVLLTCFTLTVAFDMVVAVSVGIVLAALLFMRRMAEVTHTRLMVGAHPDLPVALPDGVLLYDINGPLFFGAAQRAMSALRALDDEARSVILDLWAVVLDLEHVSSIDATGLVALLGVADELRESGCEVVLVGLQPQPRQVVEKLLKAEPGKLVYYPTLDLAVAKLTEERALRTRIRGEEIGARGRGAAV